MTRAIMLSTDYRVDLSVNIIRRTNSGESLATLPLVSLTWLVLLVWQLSLFAGRADYELATMRAIAGEVLKSLALTFMPWPIMAGG